MTVPQRRLAGLWPWLFMAALQVVLGQPGLEPERPALRAVIRVTLLRSEPAGQPITLEGLFVGGSAGYAEGKLMQVSAKSSSDTVYILRALAAFLDPDHESGGSEACLRAKGKYGNEKENNYAANLKISFFPGKQDSRRNMQRHDSLVWKSFAVNYELLYTIVMVITIRH
ncbi:hypothetical protein F2P81_008568 [Scophthalmus maximus]|uniref:Uncharacterized protein n=1 Tax=Scophthalmus maximus TaxID=52904 RepID=A0A6A4T4C7_SCOMX|nr:hypothetical protein F2P81_008568 [Scophthalmus maximus]